MSGFFKWYHHCLNKKPILTQSLTTGVMFAVGDVIAQQLVEKRGKEHDYKRTGRMSLFGACVAGPSTSLWYRFLDRYVVLPNKTHQLFARVFLDQCVYSPLSQVVYLGGTGIFERSSPEEIKEKIRGFGPALMANYKIWPAFQLINFNFVPPNYRSLGTNVVALGWNTYLSVLNQQIIERNKSAARLLAASPIKNNKKDLKKKDNNKK
ncbi:sym-1 [Anaeromyces robustus]|uniref:Sym-1 n=1 Tax=Anaeromyces robustus TaxID=1754192 RepID=A0A1Y1X6P0_9FUNG|nr:sym-1 [Anaeromyces robustus]|eukprot:ORX80964.1 sym-1 [Anaeromyces robustus]